MKKCILFVGLCLITASAFSQVIVKVDSRNPGAIIPSNFSGLSFETLAMLPNKDGKYLFTPENLPLIHLFKTLGVKNLRIGGNTADRPTVAIPSQADVDKLFAFAKAAGVDVIFTLRMRESTPKDSAALAKYITDKYKSQVVCFAIGNEPNIYAPEYSDYRALWIKFTDAIREGAPEAKFCGPSTTPGKAEWARNFATDFGSSGKVKFITQHSYPGGSGRKIADVSAGRDQMLSPEFAASYQKFENSFAPAAFANGIPYRLEETNNYFNGGAQGVSNSFASALWGLDYMYWWATQGAAGINFHTGDQVAAGEQQAPCWYAVFWKSTDGNGYAVHPLGYAIKAFDLGSHGAIVSTTVSVNPDHLNFSAYSTLSADKKLTVTLINKEHGISSHEVEVTIRPGKPYSNARVMHLSAPKNDIAAEIGIKLGGSSMGNEGEWNGSWARVKRNPKKSDGSFSVTLPSSSAAIIELTDFPIKTK